MSAKNMKSICLSDEEQEILRRADEIKRDIEVRKLANQNTGIINMAKNSVDGQIWKNINYIEKLDNKYKQKRLELEKEIQNLEMQKQKEKILHEQSILRFEDMLRQIESAAANADASTCIHQFTLGLYHNTEYYGSDGPCIRCCHCGFTCKETSDLYQLRSKVIEAWKNSPEQYTENMKSFFHLMPLN